MIKKCITLPGICAVNRKVFRFKTHVTEDLTHNFQSYDKRSMCDNTF